MVVVSDARSQIGQKVRPTVNSVLQTQAGRMIFAKMNKGERSPTADESAGDRSAQDEEQAQIR